MGSVIKVGTAILMSKDYLSPANFFKFKFLPLVIDSNCLIDSMGYSIDTSGLVYF